MSPESDVESYPLSSLQHGMLFHYLSGPDSGTDIEQMVCTLHEDLEPAILRCSWEHVVARHPVLRTSFRSEEGEDPVQVVHHEVSLPWHEHDWRGLPRSEQPQRLARFLVDDRHRGFNMSQAPILRLTLVRLGNEEYQLVWTFHHALLDGRSFPIILKEVFDFYESFRVGRTLNLPVPKPYREYIEWLQTLDPLQAEGYWRQKLEGFAGPTPLMVDRAWSAQEAGVDRQDDCRILINQATARALKTFARDNGLTLNILFQAAWALLLSRYSGEEDVVHGVVRACRKSTIEGADRMVGLFINTLPMRLRISPGDLLLDWLKQLRVDWSEMRAYEHTPLAQIQKWSRIPAGRPLFESIVMFENYELTSQLRAFGANWVNRSFRLYEQTGYPITVTVYSGDELCVQIEYDRTRFDRPTVTRMLTHVKTLLESMLRERHQRLSDLTPISEEESHQLLVEWNDTNKEYAERSVLHELFESQTRRTPDALAVVCGEQQLTYSELNSRANQLARYLQECGVGPDVLVGVCMERSLDMVVALYGVLKAGGAYVPIDPDYPHERVAFMLQDAEVPILLTQSKLVSRLPSHKGRLVCLDSDWKQVACKSAGNPAPTTSPENLAYVIYTSGSTGRPKGAMNTHRGICNRLLWMQDRYHLTEADRVLQKTPFSFDVSVWEFFWPLLVGARLVVAKPGGHMDPAYLIRLITELQITVLHFVPSMLSVFLEEPEVEGCRSLRHVICSGEALPFDLQERFFQRLPAQLHNLYGPTETAVDVTHWACQPNSERKTVPIGRPVSNTQAYILDRHLRPVPVGVPGELYIGGVQVGRGYHNRPELTAERFIIDHFRGSPGARLYKTGDLCRWLPDGNIEYLGRTDFQVKIRGLRVELGEIESALRTRPEIKEAVVMLQEVEGDKRLLAYVVPSGSGECTSTELRNYLQQKLPDYMVPAAFVFLRKLPVTPNGKLDRQALPNTAGAEFESRETWSPPDNEAEQKIAHVWKGLLGVDRVGRDSNFFDLGGHSLLMIRARGQLQHVFAKEVPLIEMFRHPTVRLLARYLMDHDTEVTALTRSREEIQAHRESARRRLLRRKVGVN